ncbi:MAG TPA: 16S rRNA (cytosine(1402)-N(4))-methyltransferase RsmH [Halanaerobiaceae bacterium]|jgi:16S rRNA (cytosine1402-N4)-methyltransferase|nr:16S rRNA (cytosine(1402)-N(4))-methyltransferase RsmH [Bacillota bacterium]HHU91618.1 16S rRNA (cytosine(1402)-N(4))-methyltransferase RsmH [Halanaerobiaceae bacterium]HOA40722.1 16S rRNA (cytosine(1402)-N(4))-methyltransferase RsmH [Halanaerobiales bacterium]HPZ62224.1 16S rRNA (cytosine(1402)-N(4))-methyltransferase RsmH [Halanaerobiales bacterium]HQD03620.1 16S rRNA (cytosine(1402)-N(4))-methyltransferase RsmH [Halanaerobiales bacterium]
MNKEHIPVLLEETIEYLNCQKEGIYIDGTLGRGGHTGEILKKLEGTGKLIGIDRDIEAIRKVEERYGKLANLDLIHDNYINIPAILDRIGIREVDGMLFDLGVSSPQFDNPERGFSYNYDAFLDMRMDQEQELTAAEIVNTYSQEDLSRIIKDYGEEKWASRIADFIVKARKRKPIERTLELVEIIKAAIPAAARRSGGHPARKTFQALRIATNNELNQLEEMLGKVVAYLKPGGRICVITFHSLEDRIVKNKFRQLAQNCTCPPDFPVCVCDNKAELKILTRKPVTASKEELANNSRARSAKLRVAEKIQ